jgi:hypothetical protein
MKKTKGFKFKKVRKFDFDNKEYKIVWKNKPFPGKHYAECTAPDGDIREIRISPSACKDQKILLSTVIDESVHTIFFVLDNKEVDTFSDNLADLLWEMGWRLPTKPLETQASI